MYSRVATTSRILLKNNNDQMVTLVRKSFKGKNIKSLSLTCSKLRYQHVLLPPGHLVYKPKLPPGE